MRKTFRRLVPSLALLAAAGLLSACANPAVSSSAVASSAATSSAATSSTTASSSAATSSEASSSAAASSSTATSSSATKFDQTHDEQDITATVDFWETFGASGTTATTMKAYAEAFQKLYPNITINLVSKDSYVNINSAISQAIPSGTTPTMAICYPDHVAGYLDSGAVEQLDSYMNDQYLGLGVNDLTKGGALDDFIASYLPECNSYSESGYYSMPFTKSTEALFYNKTMFDAKGWSVPTTWDEMWDLCATIKADTSIEGIDQVTPFGYDSDDNLFITFDEQADIPYTSLTKPHYLFDNTQNHDFVNLLKTKHDAGYFLTKGSSANSTYTSTQFTSKTLYMTVGSTGGTSYNYTDTFDVGVAGIPQVDTNSPKVISQGPSVCFFKRASIDEKRAAWLFYKFITNTDNTAYWAQVTGYNPIRTSAYTSTVWTDWKAGATTGKDKLIADVADYCQEYYVGKDAYYTSPAFKGSATCRTQVGGIISSVLLGTKTVDEAFNDAMAEVALIG
jgi:multiple sugar transport system substrate-binding protein